MIFVCDSCSGSYEAARRNAEAMVYVKDAPCNHLVTRCSHCGAAEVIYLGARKLEAAIGQGSLRVTVQAEAPEELRGRAARAWAAAEAELGAAPVAPPVAPPLDSPSPVASTPAAGEPSAAGPATGCGPAAPIPTYDLLPRHELLISAFGSLLTRIPDDLLWDGLTMTSERRLPERWAD